MWPVVPRVDGVALAAGGASEGLWEISRGTARRYAYALYNLAVVCEEKLNDHERAGSLYERAVAAAPRDSLAVADHGRFEARRDQISVSPLPFGHSTATTQRR